MKVNPTIWARLECSNHCGSSAAILLILLLFFSPLTVQAQFTYTTNAGGTSITITGGPGGALDIPSSINGLTVTSIGDGAFEIYDGIFYYPNVSLTSVTIPGTVTNIGNAAFSYCTALSEVEASNGLIQIGRNAFSDDYALNSVTIAGTVTNIGEDAFQNCTNLPNIAIPGSVVNIGYGAFENCTGLTNVVLREGCITIGDGAFIGCTKLGSVAIPATVTNVGSYAFEACSNLTRITIPGSVITIETNAFEYCTGLTNATLSNGVGNIGDYAFFGCGGLNNIVIPGSVNTIGVGAFASTSLTNLMISNGVSVIGGVAFGGCALLTSVTFPPSIQSIGEQAFWWCNSLTNVFFQGNAPAAPGDPENGGIVPFLSPAICYYLPSTTGWSNTYPGVPAVLWNPLIQTTNGNFGVRNNQFGFDITGTTNIPIVVQASTNPANPVWTSLTNVTLTNGLFHFTDPVQPNTPNRFYRIASP
jgi:hypothetical protein